MDRLSTLPRIEAARVAQPLDAMRISWWAWRGRRYTARASHGGARALRTAAVFVSWAAWPLGTLRRATAIRFRRSRYYFSRDDAAVLAVRPTGGGWLLTDYYSEHPGRGQGWWLRQWVLPTIYEAADRAGVTVRLAGTPDRVAESCAAETPSLRPSGRTRSGGVAMIRAPHPAGL